MPGTHHDDWAYLWYLVRHKFYVLAAGLTLRVPLWRLIVHDLSKLRRDEWVPYRRQFYEKKRNGLKNAEIAEIDKDFRNAWAKHKERNDHHWEHWVYGFPEREHCLDIPDAAVREMVADWISANRVINGRFAFMEWWESNKTKIKLSPKTRERVVELLHFYHAYLNSMGVVT